MQSKIFDSLANISQIANYNREFDFLNETTDSYFNNSFTQYHYTSNLSEKHQVTYKAGYIFAFLFLFIVLLVGIVGRASYSANDTVIHLNYMKYQNGSLYRSISNSRKLHQQAKN